MSKPKKVKARKIEQLPDGMGVPHCFYWMLPHDAASYDAMVEQMSGRICWTMKWPTSSLDACEQLARVALAAIGITRPKIKL